MRTLSSRHLKDWLLPFLWMAVIFVFSNQPGFDTGFSFDVLLKKSAHLIEYAILATILYRTFAPGFTVWDRSSALWSWSLSALYAASDEWHQSFIPGRHSSVWDVLIDSVGALVALWFVHSYIKRSSRKK